MIQSTSQLATLIILQTVCLALACLIARYPKKPAAGIMLGVAAGTVLMVLTAALVGFLGSVLPFGQMDFWLATLVSRAF